MIIDDYLNEVLFPQLKGAGIKYQYIVQIQNDIRNRMLSLVSFWNIEEMRKGILLFSQEEARFYFPGGKEHTREFVVTTIRNSMLEIAASDNCGQIKMKQGLSDTQVKDITEKAIVFFNKYEKAQLVDECTGLDFEDIYGIAIKKYPLAWEVIKRLANMPGNSNFFYMANEKSSIAQKLTFEDIKFSRVVCDGYTLEFDEALKQALGEVLAGKIDVFFSGCFKMISRNFEKVLHVLEILLEHDKEIITVNYYISNNYLEKRKHLIKAAHNIREVIHNIQNLNGVPPRLRKHLEDMM
ncbi:hypothetical protein [Anaerocolumna aminovalerica]|uniref:hypothetical protein n=1 Tax=Anaerocolumna aminovalerica TaxID=1527 RepID=UPI000BE3853A|nr:hypothetical protein [Anaerocolumna aminovalerica]